MLFHCVVDCEWCTIEVVGALVRLSVSQSVSHCLLLYKSVSQCSILSANQSGHNRDGESVQQPISQTGYQTEIHAQTDTNRYTEWLSDWLTDWLTSSQTYCHANRPTDRQIQADWLMIGKLIHSKMTELLQVGLNTSLPFKNYQRIRILFLLFYLLQTMKNRSV